MAAVPRNPEIEALVEDFFRSQHEPASTHEEWLLCLHSQLMHREARVVRVAEMRARPDRDSWKNSSPASAAYTAPSTETGTGTSPAS